MPSSNFVKFDLWRQLQLLNKLTNSDSSKDPLRVLFKSLRQFHSRGEPSSPDVKVVALPRSIFWRLFFGLLPLPENKKKQQQQQQQSSSQKSSPVVSSPTSDKKNLFAETSDDDEQEQQQEEDKKQQQQVKSAKAVFAESSDDDETTNNKNNKVKSPNSAENAADGGNYNPTFIRNSIDAARQEYINWLKDEGRLAAVDALARENDPAAASPEMKKKLKFGSSKKKAASAGPRFGDDSSDSDDDDDDDDIADPLADASSQKKKKTASGTNGNTNDDDNKGEEQQEDNDDDDADPLAHANDPKWQKYFARKKEIELIDKDLNRLYFDNYDFFELPATRKMAKNILEASLDLKLVSSYSQGMHEVVGLILWVLEMDAVRFDVPDDSSSDDDEDDSDSDTKKKPTTTAEANPAKHLTAHVMSKKYIEHDAFIIYKQVIQTFSLGSWYDSHPAGSEENVTRVVDDIHSRRLLKADKPLHDHLKALDVPVATYGLRWLRLLFIREYPLSQAMKIWDVIFADFATDRANKKIWTSLAPEIALSMLLYMARALVASDHTDTLRRLMRFPPIEDVTMIYINAINRNYPPSGNSSTSSAVLRELIPPNDDGRPFSKDRMDPEQVHQHSLFGQIVSAVSAAASAVQQSASEAANKTSTAVKSAIGASARAVFADSSSSDDDGDNDTKKNNKKQKHNDPLAQLANSASATSVKSNGVEQQQSSSSSSSSAMEVYALQQKMKLLGNRIDRIIIDKLDGSDSDDSSDDDDKNGEEKKQVLSEAQIKAAIVELKKIKRELMNPASK